MKQKSSWIKDTPRDSETYSCFLKPFDIILMATDGVYDNLFPSEIKQIIKEFKSSLVNEQDVTKESSYKLS